jgi:hypothetical protein
VRNNERYLAFSPAVSQAFLEVSDLRSHFFKLTFSTFIILSNYMLTNTFFLSTEIRKAGVMIQLCTIHYINTYFRMFITLSIISYIFKHRSYLTAKRVV